MSLVFGKANPALQKVLLELCFSDETGKDLLKQSHLKILDRALIDDVLSGEQLRVLPLLYRLVPIDSLSTESAIKVVGTYKHTFCRNSLMLNRLGQVQLALNQAGFAPMIGLKGLPSIAYLNAGLGARPMADVDVLIPNLHQRPDQVLTVFNSLGYKIKGSGFRSLTMISPENLELDLHWYVHDWALGQNLVDIIGAQANTHILGSQIYLIPCVEHHLAHTIAHGVLTRTLTYDARWVFDAVAILMRTRSVDVDRFAEFANRVAAPQRIKDALSAILNELPDSIAIDRAQLCAMNSAIRTNARVISWIYKQTPVPNLPSEKIINSSRMDRLKGVMITFVLMPRYLRKHEGLSFISYWRWCDAFPPVSHGQAALMFIKRILEKGPKFLYRIIVGK
jgi:hypothetical protein